MALSEYRHGLRQDRLTASDVPAVLGLNRFKGPRDVWHEKIHRLGAHADAGEAALLGSLLEPVLIGRAVDECKIQRKRSNVWQTAENGVMAATLDAKGVDAQGNTVIIEAKSSGLLNPMFDDEEWGRDGSDEVPDHVRIQCVAQLVCVPEASAVIIPALLGNGIGYRQYRIDRDAEGYPELIGDVEKLSVEWWNKHIVEEREPNADPPNIETLRRIDRTPGKTVHLDHDKVDAWLKAKEAAKAADEQAKKMLNEIISELGDAEVGQTPEGVLTYKKENAGWRLDVARIKREHPDVYRDCGRQTHRFVPRWKERSE